MSKIFLLLGGNKLNHGIVEKFQNKGYLVYVIDWNEQPQLIGDKHYQIDIKDTVSIIDTLKREGVWEEVCFAYSSIDLAVPSVVSINRAIGLHTLSDEALRYATSKSKMVEKWKELKLLNRYSTKIECYSTEFYELAQRMKVIIKPDNSASSRGITILPQGADEKQCKNAYDKAKAEATNDLVVLEEFVEGTEYTVEMLGDSYGNVSVYAISKKTHTSNTDANKIAVKLHYNAIPDELQQKIADYGIACYKALGFTSSLGHLEVIMKKDGTISPVEIGARSSGFIASDLVDIVSDADYLDDLIDIQKGSKVLNGMHHQSEESSVYFFYDFPEKSMIVKERNLMDFMDSSIISRFHDRSCIKRGHHFSKISNDNARQGFEVIEGPKRILTTDYLKERERLMMRQIVLGGQRDIEQYIGTYLEAPFTKENSEFRRKCVLEQLKKYKHSRILEIGCGMYPLFTYIEPLEYERYTVVEPGEIFVENAQKTIKERKLGNKVSIARGYFEEANLLGEYDFIICSSLLHEVDSPKRLLERIYEIAALNTVVHINVPNAYSLHRLIAKEAGMISDVYELSLRNKDLQQRKVYDLKLLSDEMEAAGFSILETGSYFVKPFTHKQMSEMLEQKIIDKKVLDGLWGLGKYLPQYGSEIYVNMRKG